MCVCVCVCVCVCIRGMGGCQLFWRPPHGCPGISIVGTTNSAQESQGSLPREGTVIVELGIWRPGMGNNLSKVTLPVICRAGIEPKVAGFLISGNCVVLQKETGFGI